MVLLDTHILLWTLFDEKQLTPKVVEIMENSDCCISIASMWELAIKMSRGKLRLPKTLREIADECALMGIEIVGISMEDCICLRSLPWIHKDPFDRIILSHAIAEHMPLISHDSFIQSYEGVQVIW